MAVSVSMYFYFLLMEGPKFFPQGVKMRLLLLFSVLTLVLDYFSAWILVLSCVTLIVSISIFQSTVGIILVLVYSGESLV